MMITKTRDIAGVASSSSETSLSTAILRYVLTARYLRTKQALYWLYRRHFGRRYGVPPAAYAPLRKGVAIRAMAATMPTGLAGNSFKFLSDQHTFPGPIDWHLATKSRLWSYNLHYFDYSLDQSRDLAWTMQTMLHWISAVPPKKSVGWEPYPTSLRVVNWIKFALTCPESNKPGLRWRTSLYQQVAWLENNIEHEIQANHLLKNAKALVFAGAYFAGPDADRWARRGLALLLRECSEQFLADGGHYERSAMYHAIALEDILDIISLAQANSQLTSVDQADVLRHAAEAALAYLIELTYPDGAIPKFNDSADGLAKETTILTEYGRLLSLNTAAPRRGELGLINRPATGYYGYRLDDEMLVIDAGPIGPAHQPGHGHCDMLSLELMLRGRSIIVNSGVYDYENTPVRTMLRQTAAHSTVRVDQMEQSDVWGCFRVGRRALPGPIDVGLARSIDRHPFRFRFSGSHLGYQRLAGRPTHHRMIECDVGQRWNVTDEIRGHGRHHLENFLHFHPDLHLQKSGQDWIVIDDGGRARYRLSIFGGQAEFLQTVFCAEFGMMQHKTTICVSATVTLPHVFGYSLSVL